MGCQKAKIKFRLCGIAFSNGTIRGFSNKSERQYGTVNDFKKFSIQRKMKNDTVRYDTIRYGSVRFGTV